LKVKYNLIEIKPNDKMYFISGNRNVNRQSVEKLKRSMEEWGVLTAITVMKSKRKYYVIDGQHRYTAAKELGYVIPAIVVPRESVEVIIDLNTLQKNWSLEDYANYYSESDDKVVSSHYSFLKNIREQGGLNYTALIRIFTTCSLSKFKKGEMVIDDAEFGFDFIEQLSDISEFVPFAENSRFIDAFVKIARNENYSHSRMMRKLELNDKKGKYPMDGESKPSSYGRLMQEIYNMSQSTNLVMFYKW
tara:strand:- start:2815 stop:3555 length:741 start_codon:yes stop_codon:yes gene_type:complete